eukprot:3441667-Rhodomonas_salina.1
MGSTATLHGSGFSPCNPSPASRVQSSADSTQSGSGRAGTAPAWTAWASESSTTCLLASGVGSGMAVVVSQALLTASLSVAWSYNNPSVKLQNPANVQFRGAVPITLVGSNLGKVDLSPVARVGGTACEASRWRSDSSLVVSLSYKWSVSPLVPFAITVDTGLFTALAPFRFDELQMRKVAERVPV